MTKQVFDDAETTKGKGHTTRVVDHVVEQRFSNLAQGLLILGTMSGPLLVVLHLIPQGVLAGLFFIMGIQALEANGISNKILYLCRDKSLTSASDPLSRIQRKRAIWYFVLLELLGFGATFAITQTIAAIGFPIFILVLVPVRTFLLPRYFTPEELSLLDAPTASPFTMESAGGIFDSPPTSTPPEADDDSTHEVQDTMEENDLVERGEASTNRKDIRRRTSFRSEAGGAEGESIEMHRVNHGPRSLRRPSQAGA